MVPLNSRSTIPPKLRLEGCLGRVVGVPHRLERRGSALTAHVLATAVELNEKAACRAVVVTALNPRARDWWQRLGFRPLDPDQPEQLDLYVLTAEI